MLRLYTLFHCNLAFSMVPRAHFPRVIERCYRPILDLARGGAPVAVEMSAWTLREVAAIDPGFVEELKALWHEGRCEFVGSGYSQAIFPLIPAEVNRWNLEAGNRHYRRLLGKAPVTALVNEQTFSKGLVDLYAEAGFKTIIMDWNNCYEHNRYPKGYKLFPQRAEGFAVSINVLWSDTIAFQKFQRCVHGEVPEEDYLDYLMARYDPAGDTAFVVYSNDAEVFDFRPGSDAEPSGEFGTIKRLLKIISNDGRAGLFTPGQIVEGFKGDSRAFNTVRLESPEAPVVCKKQGKYNPVRWAVAGRDSAHINTECYRAYNDIRTIIRGNAATVAELDAFKETLCLLWGSDFRTHTIDEKFMYFHKELGWLRLSTERLLAGAVEKGVAVPIAMGGGVVNGCSNPAGCCGKTMEEHDCGCNPAPPALVDSGAHSLRVDTGAVRAEFLTKKGFALKGLVFPGVSQAPLVGTLEHGYYDEMSLGADFFSGHLIHTARDGRKTTDLGAAVPVVEESAEELVVSVKLPLDIGTLWKVYAISKSSPEVRLTYRLKVDGLNASSFRLGIFTFNPGAFDRNSLWFESTNGGAFPERFYLKGHQLKQDDPVSQRVSSSSCLGATDGTVRVGDAEKFLQISTDKSGLYSVPMLRYTEIEDTFFFRVYHSVGEVDDTAWWVWRGYNEISFTLSAGRVEPEGTVRKLWEYSKRT